MPIRLFATVALMLSCLPGPVLANTLVEIRPFLQEYCLDCHGAQKQKGDYRFDTLGTDLSDIQTLETWQNILDQLNLGEMPPRKSLQPEKDEWSPVVEQLTG